MFGGLFGGGGQRQRRGRSTGPTRGQDANAEVTLSFDEAMSGETLPLQLSGPGTCRTCGGNGAKPGTSARTCPTCAGSGFVSHNQGAFGFSEPCRDCKGTGKLIDEPCPDCAGSGVTVQTRTINIRVPAGIKDGSKVKVAGKGMPGTRGGPAGDLFVTVHVSQHDLFARKGDDLTMTVPVTLRRGRARHHDPSADARRRGVAQGAGGHADRAHAAGPRPRRAQARRPRRPAGDGRGRRAGEAERRREGSAGEVRRAGPRRPAPEHHGARVARRGEPWLTCDPHDVPEDAPGLRHLGRGPVGRHARPDAAPVRPARAGQPGRTGGGGRRYSARDVALLREVQRLSQDEGVNLAGIKRVIELESQVDALRSRVSELAAELDRAYAALDAARGPVHRPGGLEAQPPLTAVLPGQRPTCS